MAGRPGTGPWGTPRVDDEIGLQQHAQRTVHGVRLSRGLRPRPLGSRMSGPPLAHSGAHHQSGPQPRRGDSSGATQTAFPADFRTRAAASIVDPRSDAFWRMATARVRRAAFALLLWGRPTAARDQRRWSSRMRPYEVMVIFDPDTEERSVQPTLEQYLTVITKGGGTVDGLDIWGRRRLAYEIRKKSEGIYAVINLTANPADVKELDRQFTISEQIMRTKVIRPDLH